MNISTQRFVMASVVGLGLFAVLFAYRAGQKSADGSWEAKPRDFGSLKELANQNLLNIKPPAVADPMVAKSMPMPIARTEPVWESTELPPAEAADLLPSFDAPVEPVEPNVVQSFNYLPDNGAEPVRVAENVGMAAQAPIVAEPEPSTSAGVKQPNWQQNPFVGRTQNTDSRSSQAYEPTDVPQSTESTENADSLPSLEFSSTGASAIGSIVTDEANAELTIDSAVDQDTPAQAAQYTSPAVPEQMHVPPAAPGVTAPITAGLDRTAATQAVHHIEYGKSLARRSAREAAKQEFYSALHVLAQSNDLQTQSNQYTSALRAGVAAMKEAQDFVVADPQHQIRMNIGHIVEAHDTQLIGQTRARNMTATQAMQEYFEHAGQQLSLCGGQNVVAAEALYCLGKLTSLRSMADSSPLNFDLAKSVIYHRASMGADPQNHRSANELGVLLAREGRLGDAEAWLKKSLMINPVAQSWGNLAKVHRRKGTPKDLDLAAKAQREHELALHNASIGVPSNQIRWVEPAEFIRSSPRGTAEAFADATQAVQQAVVPVSNIEVDNGSQEHQTIADKIRNWVPQKVRR